MKFNVFQLSRKGGRKNNEDRMGYCYTRDAALFVLADGMGGHSEGEVAAQLALQTRGKLFATLNQQHRFKNHEYGGDCHRTPDIETVIAHRQKF